MPARNQSAPTTEAVISVSEMARRLTLSRARFYELIQEGIFPSPIYCIHTRRAMYPLELQRQCLEVRESNVGVNGRYILFYRPRSASPSEPVARTARSNRSDAAGRIANPILTEIRQGLGALGMAAATDDQIRSALAIGYPSGTAGIDSGTVLASVFRLLRSPHGARTTAVPDGLPRAS